MRVSVRLLSVKRSLKGGESKRKKAEIEDGTLVKKEEIVEDDVVKEKVVDEKVKDTASAPALSSRPLIAVAVWKPKAVGPRRSVVIVLDAMHSYPFDTVSCKTFPFLITQGSSQATLSMPAIPSIAHEIMVSDTISEIRRQTRSRNGPRSDGPSKDVIGHHPSPHSGSISCTVDLSSANEF